jgi:hypothetical protein
MLIKFRIPEIVLGVLLTVAVFAMGYVAASSVPPPSQQIENTDHQQAANEGAERTAEKQIAYYTKWLAWFTGALVAVSGIQGYFLLRADNTARLAANAADLSARAAVAIELPIIRIDPDNGSFGVRQEFGIRTEELLIQHVGFKNDGRTKAFPIEVAFGWTVGDTLPANPVYRHTKPFGVDSIIGPDILQVDNVNLCIDLPDGGYDQLRSGSTNFWFYCRFAYLDFMQTRHEAGFCWSRFEGIGGGRFVRDETPAYNRRT